VTTTFENGVISHTHLVTYPSVWLAPPPSLRICLIGYDSSIFEQLSQHCQHACANQNIAFYMLDRFDLNMDQSRLDWLLINESHCDAVISSANTWQSAAITASLNCKLRFWQLDDHSIISSLARNESHIVSDITHAIDQIVALRQRRTSQ
jgi:hypothetical protein